MLYPVREDTAVELCKKHFGVCCSHAGSYNAACQKWYISLVEKEKIEKSSGNLLLIFLTLQMIRIV